MRYFLLALGFIFLFITLDCSWGGKGKPENVVLIIVDTLRSDHLGCYGYDGVETPHIDNLAKTGIRFEEAISHAPITLPSISSILTSLIPFEHGVHYNEGYRLPDDVTTLAEVLAGAGFETAAFVSAVVLDSVFGTHQGFDHFDASFPDPFRLHQASLKPLEVVFGKTQRRAEDVTTSAISWLDGREDGPFFLLLHYFDPHIPYDPPPPFAPAMEEGKYEEILTQQIKFYDGEIAYTDHQIGIFLDSLREKDLVDNTLIVFTSDHGEGLGDKGEDTHSVFLYESTIRVPLILSGATGFMAGRVIEGPVRLIDIYPTILDILTIEPPPGIAGESLVPVIATGADEVERPVYLETYANRLERGWSILKGVRLDGWKYIEAPTPELYFLEDDPGETRNLYEVNEHVGMGMEAKLRELEERPVGWGRMEPRITDKSFIERVRSLGYIGVSDENFDFEVSEVGGVDPKEIFPEFQRARYTEEYLRLALMFMQTQQLNGARFFLDKSIELDPDNPLPRYYLAEVCRQQGLNDKGLNEIDFVLRREPENAEAHYLQGLLYSQAGKDDLALESFERAVGLDPNHAQAYNNMGLIYGEREDFETASSLFERALEINPDLPQARVNAGNVHFAMGRSKEATKEWELALLLDPGMKNMHIFLGNAYFQQNEYEKALDHYESFLATDPDSMMAMQVQGWMETIRKRMESDD